MSGNWTARKSESCVPDLPAGMRIPRPLETGLGEQLPEIADKLIEEGTPIDELRSKLQNER